MPQFKNTADLLSFLRKSVDKALTTDVFPAVRDMEIEAINETVYSHPASNYYRRREESGGLGDPSNIIMKGGGAKNGILAVINITPPNPYLDGVSAAGGMATVSKSLPSVVEYGYGYDYWKSPRTRPFTKNTIKKLSSSGVCAEALKQGLLKQGITAR